MKMFVFVISFVKKLQKDFSLKSFLKQPLFMQA